MRNAFEHIDKTYKMYADLRKCGAAHKSQRFALLNAMTIVVMSGTEEGEVEEGNNKANRNNHEKKKKKRRTNRCSPLHLGRRCANAKLSKF